MVDMLMPVVVVFLHFSCFGWEGVHWLNRNLCGISVVWLAFVMGLRLVRGLNCVALGVGHVIVLSLTGCRRLHMSGVC